MKDRKIPRFTKMVLTAFVLGALLGLGSLQSALAAISPAGCTDNVFSVDLLKNKSNVVPGEVVTYTVQLENEGASTGCDVTDITFDFYCPAADGTSTGLSTNVVTGANYAYGFPLTTVGTFDCTMPQFNPGVNSAQAKVAGNGLLQDNDPADPLDVLKTVSVRVLTCDVQVDKQISCDGGLTWADAGAAGAPNYAPDGANGCSALDQDQILVRYWIKGAGTADLSQCSFDDDNNLFGEPDPSDGFPTEPFIIGTGTENVYDALLTPLCKDAYPNEPDTATVECNVCNGVTLPTPEADSDTATLSCLSTSVKVDKQIDCGGGFVDMYGLTADNDVDNGQDPGACISPADCQTQGCKAPENGPVGAFYVAKNTGTAPLYACELVDSNEGFGPVNPQIGNLAVDQQKTFTPPNEPLCDSELQADEPDTLTLTCCVNNVASLQNCPEGKTVQAFDMADVECIAPDLEVTKTCALTQDEQDLVTVTVQNTGAVPLANCVATDQYYPQDDTCDMTGLPDANAPETGTPTSLPLLPAIPDLAVGSGEVTVTALFTPESDSCNTVGVTCDVVGTETQITAYAKDECPALPEEGCLTRTPGFWATHPFIIEDLTASVKNGVDRSLDLLPLSVCGTELNTTAAVAAVQEECSYDGHSTSEAMCSVGTDSKCFDRPQLAQLIRQCTAAKLNIAASEALEGSCRSTMNIGETIEDCCETADTCVAEGVRLNFCIDQLDAFNNYEMDTLNFPFKTGAADSSQCKNAKNNKVVVSP